MVKKMIFGDDKKKADLPKELEPLRSLKKVIRTPEESLADVSEEVMQKVLNRTSSYKYSERAKISRKAKRWMREELFTPLSDQVRELEDTIKRQLREVKSGGVTGDDKKFILDRVESLDMRRSAYFTSKKMFETSILPDISGSIRTATTTQDVLDQASSIKRSIQRRDKRIERLRKKVIGRSKSKDIEKREGRLTEKYLEDLEEGMEKEPSLDEEEIEEEVDEEIEEYEEKYL